MERVSRTEGPFVSLFHLELELHDIKECTGIWSTQNKGEVGCRGGQGVWGLGAEKGEKRNKIT